MSSPVLALRRAVLAALSSDGALTALLGGAHVYDEAPPGAPAPRIAFSDAQAREWSALDSRGAEQVFVVTVWSHARGMREALDVAPRARVVGLVRHEVSVAPRLAGLEVEQEAAR